MAVDLSFLEPYFSALAQVPHLQQAAAQQEDQQQQLAETNRHNQADEAVAGRHADIAADANRRAQQAQDLSQADTIMKNGWTPVGGATSQAPGASETPAAPVDLTNETNDGDPANAAGGAPPAPGVPGLTGSLMAAAGTAPSPAAATPRQTMTVGGQQYQAPPAAGTPQWKEEHARQLQQGIDDDAAKYGARLNHEGWSIPDEVADQMQIPRGQKIMPEHADEFAKLHNAIAPPDKQFKPEPPPSMVTLSATDSKLMGLPAGTRVPMDEYKARGTVAAEASRAARGEGGTPAQKPATKGQLSEVTAAKTKALGDSQATLEKDLKAATKGYTDATDVGAYAKAKGVGLDTAKAALASGAAKAAQDRVAAVKQAYADHKSRSQQAQLSYEERLGTLTGDSVGHNDWADRMGAEATPAAGGQGPATPPVKQLTDASVAANYLKKAGGDKDAARKLAAADGWKF